MHALACRARALNQHNPFAGPSERASLSGPRYDSSVCCVWARADPSLWLISHWHLAVLADQHQQLAVNVGHLERSLGSCCVHHIIAKFLFGLDRVIAVYERSD